MKILKLVAVLLVALAFTGCAELDRVKDENSRLKRANEEQKSRITYLEQRLKSAGLTIENLEQSLADRDRKIEDLRGKFKQTPGVDFINTPEGIVIRMSNKILFALGQDTLDSKAISTINKVGAMLRTDFAGHHFRVAGHTDRVPLKSTAKYKSQWHLACSRACSVVTYLVDKKYVDPTHIQAAGNANYKPAVPWNGRKNVPENRRVEILVLPKMADSGGSVPPGPPARNGGLPVTPK